MPVGTVMGGQGADIRLSEVIAALSFALDITEGQPMGHAARSCAIGMRLAEPLGLDAAERSSLFYALLLKDAGCSSNAARIATLFGADDFAVKHDRKLTDQKRPLANLRHLARTVAPGASPAERAARLAGIARFGTDGARTLFETRCERGADIARMIDLGEATAQAIRSLDEHWDGGGHPYGLAHEQIPLLGRVLGLCQTFEVFLTAGGLEAAWAMARRRRGRWFDPALVDLLLLTRADRRFWSSLRKAGDPLRAVSLAEPADRLLVADEERLDSVAEAFARVIDAKSPYTARHSEGVARIAEGIGAVLGLDGGARRDLRRAGLLHDIGKLGVSNLILDKPHGLDPGEWATMRRHPELTVRILSRVRAFAGLADVAGAHHERLDGSGYHLGRSGEQLGRLHRILAVADVYEALTAERPYRAALPAEQALGMLRDQAGTELCPEAFAALEAWAAAPPGFVCTLAPHPAPEPGQVPLAPLGRPARAVQSSAATWASPTRAGQSSGAT